MDVLDASGEDGLDEWFRLVLGNHQQNGVPEKDLGLLFGRIEFDFGFDAQMDFFGGVSTSDIDF